MKPPKSLAQQLRESVLLKAAGRVKPPPGKNKPHPIYVIGICKWV